MDPRLVRHYDEKYAAEGTDTRIDPRPVVRRPSDRYHAAVAALVPRSDGKDILELGAGSGTIAESFRVAGSRFSTYTVSEIAESRLAGARRNLTDPRFRFDLIDASHPASEYAPFDIVISVALIEHLIDPIEAMTETRALLKPGGFVYVDTPNIAKWTRRLKLLAGRFPSTASMDEGLEKHEGGATDLHDEGHLHYFTFRALERLLVERCGYSRVERLPYHPGGKPGPLVGSALASRWPTMFSELCIAAYA